jgi:hypothetical protein
MNKFFEVTVAVEVSIQKNGKQKLAKEVHLVDAMSVTEAEAKVIADWIKAGDVRNYTVHSVKPSRIVTVIQ